MSSFFPSLLPEKDPCLGFCLVGRGGKESECKLQVLLNLHHRKGPLAKMVSHLEISKIESLEMPAGWDFCHSRASKQWPRPLAFLGLRRDGLVVRVTATLPSP